MKKTLLIILSIFIIILVILLSKFYEYKDIEKEIQQFNIKYEQYSEKEITGLDIANIINQAVDDNEKSFIKKDEKGRYIHDDTKSVNIEVKINDLKEEEIYTMETLYNGGMSEFVKYYDDIKFKCIEKQYNIKNKIKYMLFEQIDIK